MTTLQDTVIDTIKIAQDVALDAVKQAAEAVKPFVPELPDLGFPKPHEIVDQAYDFAGKLLSRNRQFTADVLETVAV